MARAKTVQSIVAAGTTLDADGGANDVRRGAIDVRDKDGGIITIKITNGATAPTEKCVATVMIAHDTDTTPATGAAGATWKTLTSVDGPGGDSEIAEHSYQFGPEVMHVQVEFTGNTVEAVTVEAIASTVNYSA